MQGTILSLEISFWQQEMPKTPMNEFCKVSQDLGYNITIGGLFALGQDMNDSKLRSVNGGGVDGIDGWDDAYETFFYSLK